MFENFINLIPSLLNRSLLDNDFQQATLSSILNDLRTYDFTIHPVTGYVTNSRDIESMIRDGANRDNQLNAMSVDLPSFGFLWDYLNFRPPTLSSILDKLRADKII
jgi:hypothetical protein